MKSTIFWHITACSPLKVNQSFGGAYPLHLHGRKSLTRSSVKSGLGFHAGILLGLFYPEDGGGIFLRNFG
jgi:hypothetical protein